jgi:serine protease SohB
MLDAAYQLLLFSAKAFIIVILILLLIAGILALFSRGKEIQRGKVSTKNLNRKYAEQTESLLEDILPKKEFKKFIKEKHAAEKSNKKNEKHKKNIFVLNFHGDIKASAVNNLCEEVTAVIGVAKKNDEVVVIVESAGGMVHAYGLAAAQLQRFREHHIPLTVIVDKVAASGGYLMASVANKIISAPFAIIGSIGVIVQLPNFHRLLKEKNIDFEQVTAGSYKRTLTMFGHNTEEGREKLQEEINDIHKLFKDSILQYRPQINIDQVATGEHWLGTQALELNLVDSISTSDDYLLKQSKNADVFEISYQCKKSFMEKMMASTNRAVASFKETFIHI